MYLGVFIPTCLHKGPRRLEERTPFASDLQSGSSDRLADTAQNESPVRLGSNAKSQLSSSRDSGRNKARGVDPVGPRAFTNCIALPRVTFLDRNQHLRISEWVREQMVETMASTSALAWARGFKRALGSINSRFGQTKWEKMSTAKATASLSKFPIVSAGVTSRHIFICTI